MESKINEVTAKIVELKDCIKPNEKEINLLHDKCDEFEIFKRKNSLRFNGIKEEENENLLSIFTNLVNNTMKVKCTISDISVHQEERVILIVEKNHVDNEHHPFENDGVKNPIFIATSQEESIADEVTNNIMENRSYNFQRKEESNMENEPEPLRDADENKTNFIQISEKENDITDKETKDMTQNGIDNDQREDENAIESESVTEQRNYVYSEPEPFGDNSDDDPDFILTSEEESDRDEETNNMENETDNDQRVEENFDIETEPVTEQGKPRKRIRNEVVWEVTKG
ncbi:unnamed protein product [Psylliodes chrysocephalus]|uniref:Uncharacterized protein n=1 Tax=Psylliodes chrysocephalus TaxID=3402493 RepID=A0A9P0G331_9CUCU|nr:unnamed protein product [Psylliodes chrysocephala]